jgi:hypothetical protein
VRLLFLVQIDGPAFGFPVHVHVGGVGKPECCRFVQVLQGSERAAVEQVRFHIGKRPLDLPFRFRAMGAAGPGLIAVVRGEGCGRRGKAPAPASALSAHKLVTH